MARKDLAVEQRQVVGKKVQQLRRAGVTPANVYGNGVPSVSVQVDSDVLEKAFKNFSANEVIDLKIDGEKAARPVVVQKVQRHPLTSRILHTDFYQVSLRDRMKADVPLVVVGQSEAIDTYNGVLTYAIETIQVEALPLDLPSRIEVDITPLSNLEDTLAVKELVIPANVTLLTDPDLVVVKIASPRVAVETDDQAETESAAEAPEASNEEAEAESEAESSNE